MSEFFLLKKVNFLSFIFLTYKLNQRTSQLAKKKRPTFNLKEYKDFVERLIQANTIKQIYPTKEIGLILNAKLVQIKFLLIDNNKLGFIELMKHGLSDFSLVKHYLKRKFKSK